MPASRTNEQPVVIRRFDVVGHDSPSQSEFIGHVGLAAAEGFSGDSPIDLVHLAPPLGRELVDRPTCRGTVALTIDEILQIQVFVDELTSEYQASQVDSHNQYVIAPHVREIPADDGTLICRRFSCGGFVLEAYRSIDVDLVDVRTEQLPPISLTALKTAYPDRARHLDRPALREKFGIAGDGPWPVLLPGYILNSLARPEAEVRSRPFQASPGQEFFPARSATSTGGGDETA